MNGVAVGSQYGAGKRRYPLPRGLLKAGSNSIAVNVLDTYGEGGLAGPATAYGLQFDNGERVALQGPWKYRVAPGQQAPPFALAGRHRAVDAVQRNDRTARRFRAARHAVVSG